MPTLTVYCEAATSGDQSVYCGSTTYSTARQGGGSFGTFSDARVGQALISTNYYCREAFVKFDTSDLGSLSNLTIYGVTQDLYQWYNYYTTSWTVEIRTKDWGTDITSADFVAGSSLGSLTLLTSLLASSMSSGLNTFPSSANFIAALNQSGYTYMVINSSLHRTGSSPSGSNQQEAGFYTDHPTGTSNDSKLTITYTDAAAIYRSYATNSNASANSLVITKPSGVVDDDLLIAFMYGNDSGTTITAPAGWNALDTYNDDSATYRSFYKIASSEGSDYTFSFGSTVRVRGTIVAFSNVDTDNPIDVSSITSNTGTVYTATGVTTTETETLLVYCAIADTSSVATLGSVSGWDEIFKTLAADAPTLIASLFKLTAGSTGDISNDTSENEQYGTFLIAINGNAGIPIEAAFTGAGDFAAAVYQEQLIDPAFAGAGDLSVDVYQEQLISPAFTGAGDFAISAVRQIKVFRFLEPPTVTIRDVLATHVYVKVRGTATEGSANLSGIADADKIEKVVWIDAGTTAVCNEIAGLLIARWGKTQKSVQGKIDLCVSLDYEEEVNIVVPEADIDENMILQRKKHDIIDASTNIVVGDLILSEAELLARILEEIANR